MMAEAKKLKLTLIKSAIGYNVKQKRTVRALGLRKLNASVVHDDTAPVRGMIDAISHLVKVEEL